MNIRLKAVFGTMIIFTAVLVLFMTYTFQFLQQAKTEELSHRAKEIVEMVSIGSTKYILAEDFSALRALAKDFTEHDDIAFVTISANDQIIAHSQNHGLEDDITVAKERLYEDGLPIAEISVGYRNHFSDAVSSPFGRLLMYGAATIGILAIIMMYVVTIAVTRPLRKLCESSISMLERPELIPRNDEISASVALIEHMQSKIDSSNNKLQESLRDQKFTFAEAKQIEEKNLAIYNASHDAIIVANDQDIIIEFSPIAEQLFGWERHEIIGRTMADTLVPKALREAHIKGMQHFLKTGEGPVLNQRIELAAIRRSGREFPIEISISAAKTTQGYIFVSYIRDITQRLIDQTELKLAAHAFNVSDAMFISDSKGHIIRTNPAFTAVTGYKREEVEGAKPRTLSANPEDSTFHKLIWSDLLEKGVWNGELPLRHKNGHELTVRMSMTAVMGEDGLLSHYVAHFFDLTEQKHYEAVLRQAHKEAEQASESKGRFLAAMSHEIRTPMNGVLGVLGLLKETQLTPDQGMLVKTARDSGELLLAIINDILDFSKMEAGKLSLENSPFDIYALINQTAEILRPNAEGKGLSLCADIDENTPQYLIGDGDRIRQIVLNFLSNAIKHTSTGNITIALRCLSKSATRSTIVFEVQDTGIGIDTEHLKTIFDEFTMVENTYDRTHEGSGLGLTICKQLVDLMGGEISVKSEVGIGSTFRVEVTLKLAEKQDVMITNGEITLDSQNTVSSNLRILMAEDNPANQIVLRTMLEMSGLSVDIASNGKEAVEAVKNIPYDIVLMDISMPEMDGITATKVIRQLDSPAKDVVIVALTAHAIRGDKEHFLSSGMNDFVSKPFTRAAIMDCLSRWQVKLKSPEASDTRHHLQPHIGADIASNLPDNNLVNEATLSQLVKDTSSDVVPDLVVFYLSDARTRVEKITNAAIEKDYYTLEFEAHTLGSSAAAHGNSGLCDACRQIEQQCIAQQFDSALQTAESLKRVAEASFVALEARLQKGFTA
ncbi:PAS domain S-box protein [Enterovibrio sp. ZSDZ35]|uniref:histidine kinase n=1 Tax=Enterovibrio qingdaonensis TaxID=2899818 RepID=A0ABT5QSH6_9GAMM|nr:PAS domain S-box protein [Enterovibrio sp. ZSDZ35]MDD1783941.1 PAS domain S-box protein [Enterovibrio sp. ZSDZ35]